VIEFTNNQLLAARVITVLASGTLAKQADFGDPATTTSPATGGAEHGEFEYKCVARHPSHDSRQPCSKSSDALLSQLLF
jgi:hypothetical protein